MYLTLFPKKNKSGGSLPKPFSTKFPGFKPKLHTMDILAKKRLRMKPNDEATRDSEMYAILRCLPYTRISVCSTHERTHVHEYLTRCLCNHAMADQIELERVNSSRAVTDRRFVVTTAPISISYFSTHTLAAV